MRDRQRDEFCVVVVVETNTSNGSSRKVRREEEETGRTRKRDLGMTLQCCIVSCERCLKFDKKVEKIVRDFEGKKLSFRSLLVGARCGRDAPLTTHSLLATRAS